MPLSVALMYVIIALAVVTFNAVLCGGYFYIRYRNKKNRQRANSNNFRAESARSTSKRLKTIANGSGVSGTPKAEACIDVKDVSHATVPAVLDDAAVVVVACPVNTYKQPGSTPNGRSTRVARRRRSSNNLEAGEDISTTVSAGSSPARATASTPAKERTPRRRLHRPTHITK